MYVWNYAGVIESKWKRIASGIVGFSVALAMGAYLIINIQSQGMAESVQSHWGAWVFGIGSLILLFPLSDWKAEIEESMSKNTSQY